MGDNMDESFVPPSNYVAEQGVIGSLLLDALSIIKIDFLQHSDFFAEHHGMIFKAIASMVADRLPVDVITLGTALNGQGILDYCGGLAYLSELSRGTPSAANITSYARGVKDCAVRRELLRTGVEICEIATNLDGVSAEEKQASAIQLMQAIATSAAGNDDASHVSDVIKASVERMQARIDMPDGQLLGISFGLEKLDAATEGMQAGQLITIAGRPGMGKSALGLLAAITSAISGKKTMMHLYEMSKVQTIVRAKSILSDVELWRIDRGMMNADEYNRFVCAISKLNDAPLWMDDRILPVERIAALARRRKMTTGLDLMVIDQLSLIPVSLTGSKTRAIALGEITRALKSLARELKIPIVLLHQLNRDSSKGGGVRRPVIADLKDSGSVEEDSDIVLLIHRPGYYSEELPQGEAEIIIGKQRDGQQGIVPVGWVGKYTKFQDDPVYEQPSPAWKRDGFDDL